MHLEITLLKAHDSASYECSRKSLAFAMNVESERLPLLNLSTSKVWNPCEKMCSRIALLKFWCGCESPGGSCQSADCDSEGLGQAGSEMVNSCQSSGYSPSCCPWTLLWMTRFWDTRGSAPGLELPVHTMVAFHLVEGLAPVPQWMTASPSGCLTTWDGKGPESHWL